MKRFTKGILITSIVLLIILITSFTFFKKYERREKLNQLYQEGLIPAYYKENNFCPAAEIAYFDSILALPTTSPENAFMAKCFKARSHLKIGEEQKAIDILQDLLYNTPNLTNELKSDVGKYLAISYLRLGERSSCIFNHSGGSCIFPIQGKGIYTDPTYSQKGIELYKVILTQNPSDYESRWLLNMAYMTIGEYPGTVPAEWLIPGLDTDTSSIKVHPFKDMAGNLKLNSSKNM